VEGVPYPELATTVTSSLCSLGSPAVEVALVRVPPRRGGEVGLEEEELHLPAHGVVRARLRVVDGPLGVTLGPARCPGRDGLCELDPRCKVEDAAAACRSMVVVVPVLVLVMEGVRLM